MQHAPHMVAAGGVADRVEPALVVETSAETTIHPMERPAEVVTVIAAAAAAAVGMAEVVAMAILEVVITMVAVEQAMAVAMAEVHMAILGATVLGTDLSPSRRTPSFFPLGEI